MQSSVQWWSGSSADLTLWWDYLNRYISAENNGHWSAENPHIQDIPEESPGFQYQQSLNDIVKKMLIICAPWCQACLKVEGGQFQHVLMCGKVFNKTVNVDSIDGLLFISDTILISTCFLNYSIFAKGNTSRRKIEELEYRKHLWTVILL